VESLASLLTRRQAEQQLLQTLPIKQTLAYAEKRKVEAEPNIERLLGTIHEIDLQIGSLVEVGEVNRSKRVL
jgi:hypothetical protein